MGRTQTGSKNIKDGGVFKEDINTQTPGQALITSLIVDPASGLSLTYSGVDPGTGDVVISVLPMSPGEVPSFVKAVLSADQPLSKKVLTKVLLDVESIDVGNEYDPAGMKFMANADGIYEVMVYLNLLNEEKGDLNLYININDSIRTLARNTSNIFGQDMIELFAGDTLEVFIKMFRDDTIIAVSSKLIVKRIA